MDEDGEDLTPFWLQNTTNIRRTDRLRRRASSLFFSSGVVIFLLLVTALFFLVFVLPSTLSFTTQIFRPNNVKKSWDSLNIVLVLVAVVFGFLSRIKNEDKYDELQSSPVTTPIEEAEKPKPTNVDQWFNFNTIESQKPTTSYANPEQWYQQLGTKDPFLKRNSSSYPDLREFSSNRYDYGDYSRIFNDDLNLDSVRVTDTVNHHHRRHRSVSEIESFETIPRKTKTIIVDTLVTRSEKPTASTPPPPTTSPPPENRERRQTERVIRRKQKRVSTKQRKEPEPINPITEPKPPLPPSPEQPPAPPSPVANSPEFQEMPNLDYQNVLPRNKARPSRNIQTSPPQPPPPEKLSHKKSATKDFLNSFYHKKKKKPRQKSGENLDSLIHQSQEPITVHYTPPPVTAAPPPPPPPPTTFQNIFLTKKQKRKKTISVTFPPPPPPPPPPRTPAKPPTNNKIKPEENANSGGESPLSRIPPPPPPPPPAYFKNPAWKFVVEGDYVRVNSSNSSRSGSPDIDDAESDVTPLSDGLLTPFHPSPAFCQSPDVNSKAESFITSFRAKLKLEKAHSMNGRTHLGPSGLGRSSGPRRI